MDKKIQCPVCTHYYATRKPSGLIACDTPLYGCGFQWHEDTQHTGFEAGAL